MDCETMMSPVNDKITVRHTAPATKTILLSLEGMVRSHKKRGRRPANPKPSSHLFALSSVTMKTAVGPLLPPLAPVSEKKLCRSLPTTGDAPPPSPGLYPNRAIAGKGKTPAKPRRYCRTIPSWRGVDSWKDPDPCMDCRYIAGG